LQLWAVKHVLPRLHWRRMTTPGPTLPTLTEALLCTEASAFAQTESAHWEQTIWGVTDGKAIGTYVEAKFQEYLKSRYTFELGSAAKGIDFPGMNVDLKVTSVDQPQSSCPFRSARQKIYGLGYAVLIFVYEKSDNEETRTGRLDFKHTIFVEPYRTADYQTTTGFRRILENNGNQDDLIAFMEERNLPIAYDSTEARDLAQELLRNKPEVGYLTMSNALQWRLQYGRVISQAGNVTGINRVR
jgi:hypothetical protein